VLRGGSWSDDPGGCRSASRGKFDPDYRFNLVGFRVVVVVAPRTP
jgi:formylglycine-generating enzyme required for sulfatase activity